MFEIKYGNLKARAVTDPEKNAIINSRKGKELEILEGFVVDDNVRRIPEIQHRKQERFKLKFAVCPKSLEENVEKTSKAGETSTAKFYKESKTFKRQSIQ